MFNFRNNEKGIIKDMSFVRDRAQRVNSNMMIVGGLGAGKTTSLKKLIKDERIASPEMQQLVVTTSMNDMAIPDCEFETIICSPEHIKYNPFYGFNKTVDIHEFNEVFDSIVSFLEIVADERFEPITRGIIDKAILAVFNERHNTTPSINEMAKYLIYNKHELMESYGGKLKDYDSVISAMVKLNHLWPGLCSGEMSESVEFDSEKNYMVIISNTGFDQSNTITALSAYVAFDIVWDNIAKNHEKRKLSALYMDDIDYMLRLNCTEISSEDIKKIIQDMSKRLRMRGASFAFTTSSVDEMRTASLNCSYLYVLNAVDYDEYSKMLYIPKDAISWLKDQGRGTGLWFNSEINGYEKVSFNPAPYVIRH